MNNHYIYCNEFTISAKIHTSVGNVCQHLIAQMRDVLNEARFIWTGIRCRHIERTYQQER